MGWEQYRREKKLPLGGIWGMDYGPPPFGGNQLTSQGSGKAKRAIGSKRVFKDKIGKLRHHSPPGEKRLSSVSLPIFSQARLHHAVKYHRKHFHWHWQHSKRRCASESEILLACLVLLLSKLKNRQGLARQLNGPRLRLYNDNKYSYETVSVYADRELWLALQARALEFEVSLSYLADLALRLYLRQVMERLAQRDASWRDLLRLSRVPASVRHPSLAMAVGVDYLRNLLGAYSYQKRAISASYGHPAWGKPGVFSLWLTYAFGGKSPPAA